MFLTTQQTAAALSVTPQRVRQLIKAGRIKAVRFGRDWQIDAKSVKEYQPGKVGRPWPLKAGDRVHLSGGDRFHDDVSGVVYDVRNNGAVLEVIRDGTDYPIRVNVADYKSLKKSDPTPN